MNNYFNQNEISKISKNGVYSNAPGVTETPHVSSKTKDDPYVIVREYADNHRREKSSSIRHETRNTEQNTCVVWTEIDKISDRSR